MANKTLNTRIQHKTDHADNWSQAKNFSPLKGEMIVYQENGISQIKIGDGNTNVNDLPFIAEQVQSDWDENVETSGAFIKNKPNVKVGSGANSTVIGTGDAQGAYSVAGGSNDSDEIDKVKKMAQLAGYTVDTDKATAYGDGSLSLGVGTKAYSMGSMAIGISNSAGAKGFYWHSIDWSGDKPVIQLSIEQKPYRYYKVLGQTIEQNKTAAWNTEASTLLSSWVVGDKLTIVNNSKYGEGTVITAIDTTNGKITVESLPFAQTDVKVEFSSLSDITKLVLSFDDFSIYNPSKPNAGILEFAYGALSLGLMTNASGSFATALGYNTKVTTDFGHAEGRDNIAGYSSHAEGYFNKALSIACHAEGGNNEVNGDLSHVEGTYNQANGNVSHAEGKSNIVEGYSSHAEGEENLVKGNISHAEGKSNEVSGSFSHSEGYDNVINNCSYSHVEGVYNEINSNVAHVEGQKNTAIGSIVHAEGGYNIAKGDISHVEGNNNQANGDISHAEGTGNIANGPVSHVEGKNNIAKGYCSHVEGKFNVEDIEEKYAHIVGNGNSNESRSNAHTLDWNGNAWYAGEVYVGGTDKDKGEKLVKESELPKLKSGTGEYSIIQCDVNTASGIYSSAFGYNTNAIGSYSHAEGCGTEASESYSHAEGYKTEASALSSHAEGRETKASNYYSHAEGFLTKASGQESHAEGYKTVASGRDSHAEGNATKASGIDSHAEGNATVASGEHSHAEGFFTKASGDFSHAEGYLTEASETISHAEGSYTEASGSGSHAEGYKTVASALSSHAEGGCTKASGNYSHAEGHGTKASGDYSHVQGKWNVEDTANKYAHIVGNGTSDNERSNAHTLDWDGNAEFQGDVKANACGGEEPISLIETYNLAMNASNAVVQPNWNQNDPTQPDYVKNRLAWTDDPVETVLFDGTVVNDDSIDIELIVGQEYVVTFDGVEYVLTAQGITDMVFIGSESLCWDIDNYIDTEPPFVFSTYDGGSWFYTINGEYEDEHSLKIVANIAEVHKIDEKYIKDMYYDNRTILVDFDGYRFEDSIYNENGEEVYYYLTSDTFTVDELIGKIIDYTAFGERLLRTLTSDLVEDINGDGIIINVDNESIIICNAENTVFNDITFPYKGLYVKSPYYHFLSCDYYTLQIYEGIYKKLDKKYLPDSIVFAIEDAKYMAEDAQTMAENAKTAVQWILRAECNSSKDYLRLYMNDKLLGDAPCDEPVSLESSVFHQICDMVGDGKLIGFFRKKDSTSELTYNAMLTCSKHNHFIHMNVFFEEGGYGFIEIARESRD